jgi:hypothetical protein
MADRPAEGYSKQQKFRDSDTDELVDVGDSVKRAARVRQVTPGTVKGPDGTVIDVGGEINEGAFSQDRQMRAMLRGTNDRLDKILLMMGAYFAAAGIEMDPTIFNESYNLNGEE